MTTQTKPVQWMDTDKLAKKLLDLSAKFWFLIVLVGQAIFSYYIVMFYYLATANQDIERFNLIMPGGHIEGDFWGNVAVVAHVLLAAIITVGGLVQLMPVIRSKWPAIHRWNGRLYVMTALVISLTGMFMVITRYEKIVGSLIGHTAVMINGAIIVVCAINAFKYARKKKFALHRVWALRLFLAASGVWMFRVGLMAWLSIHGKPVGFDPVSFSGPFLTTLYITVYVLPLFFLEIYLRSQKSRSVPKKLMTTTMVTLISLIMILGVFAATMGMWLPRV